MSKPSLRVYKTEREREPHRTAKSKAHIPKLMHLCAVGRPIFGPEGEVIWDGKVGIWPLTIQVPAQRRSKNRAAGTLETKPIPRITKEVYRTLMIQQVLPAIKEKVPEAITKHIIIQQDNAKPHIDVNDPEFVQVANADGYSIELTCQPPNSPDLNILDLGFFASIQSLQHQTSTRNVDELVQHVAQAYANLEAKKLNYVWISYQLAMTEIMKVQGGNNYKLAHIGKARLEREGALPNQLQVSTKLYQASVCALQGVPATHGEGEGSASEAV
ncbi:unnamed protein product [Cuscuta campestris]|uniref:Tc1-like transposase DDE domain-containing protein n=1 Tax=Cuscuta campestris TaxID=132261 RepID=A0A484KKG0_9ASTE|nr:unnamed protein product [Cuscuta campestris]